MTNQLSRTDINSILRDWLDEDVNQLPAAGWYASLLRLEAWGLAERDKGGGWSRTELGSAFLAALAGDAK